jgi:2-polyprenyl-6-methoxyphenol hydroxylase-like FAD-dependent oxidoreductase
MDVEGGGAAVVVGGGIGGLTAGISLLRAGWDVTVCESAPRLEPAGAGLFVWPNALHALGSLGLADALVARGRVLAGTGVRRPDGRWLSSLDGAAVARRYGAPLVAVARAELVDLLASALPAGSLRLGTRVVGVDSGAGTDEARVRLEGPGAGMAAQLVVGADGLRSVVRGSVWPEQPAPVYRGYTAWRAVVHAPGLVSDRAGETWGRGTRFGVVPLPDDAVYVYATAQAAAGDRTADEIGGLRQRFGRWHDPIPQLLELLDPGCVLRHDVFACEPTMPLLHRGRVALVGDAAHAMEPNLGQGACLAIEDAVVLGHVLAGPGPLAPGLSRYSRARATRTATLARRSRQLGRVAQWSAPALVTARDLAARVVPDRVAARGLDDAVGWRPPTGGAL